MRLVVHWGFQGLSCGLLRAFSLQGFICPLTSFEAQKPGPQDLARLSLHPPELHKIRKSRAPKKHMSKKWDRDIPFKHPYNKAQ